MGLAAIQVKAGNIVQSVGAQGVTIEMHDDGYTIIGAEGPPPTGWIVSPELPVAFEQVDGGMRVYTEHDGLTVRFVPTIYNDDYPDGDAPTMPDPDWSRVSGPEAWAEASKVSQALTRADQIARMKVIDEVLDDLPDADVEQLTYLYPRWESGVDVSVGQKLRHDGVLYRVIQEHTTQSDWPPPAVPALFALFRDPSDGPAAWVQPAGAHDAYQIGDRVTHNGETWESVNADNIWEPGVFGWVTVAG